MRTLGEDFRFTASRPEQVVVAPIQLDGDTPQKNMRALVRNDGPGDVTVWAAACATRGGTYVACTDRDGNASSAVLVAGAECGFEFIIPADASYLEFLASATLGDADNQAACFLKLLNIDGAPIGA